MHITPTVGFGVAGALGIAAGIGASAAFDGRIDASRERAAREGRQLPSSASETVAGVGALTGVMVAGSAVAMVPLAAMALAMSMGGSNAFPAIRNMAIGGALLGAGMVAGAGVHALLD